MLFFAGVTDNQWFANLAALAGVDEVNFWHPSGTAPFRAPAPGTPFLFKLKAPHHHIAGGGYYVKFEQLPLPLAWDAFGEKNGAGSYSALQRLIGPLRARDDGRTPEIGCSILAQPFFWTDPAMWIPMEQFFSRNIVSVKSFDSEQGEGAALWSLVKERLATSVHDRGIVADSHRDARYGSPSLVAPRLGQGAFKALVVNAYGRRCAVTGENTLPVLEAAHIRPYADDGPHALANGLLLRSDFHKLFDAGLVTVDPDYRVVVSARIREAWYNGKVYYRLHGKPLEALPAEPGSRPGREYLEWHNAHRYEKTAISHGL